MKNIEIGVLYKTTKDVSLCLEPNFLSKTLLITKDNIIQTLDCYNNIYKPNFLKVLYLDKIYYIEIIEKFFFDNDFEIINK